MSYERVSAYDKWAEASKLGNVLFYLTSVANLFRNHKADLSTWASFKASFSEVVGRPAICKLCADQWLRTRAQLPEEPFTSYIEVVDLCKCINASMPEADKIHHLMKVISGDAFQMLLARDPCIVADVIKLCQSCVMKKTVHFYLSFLRARQFPRQVDIGRL